MIECDFGEDGFATRRDKCTFTCDDGYELKGLMKRMCLVWWGRRTKWTGTETECKEGKVVCNVAWCCNLQIHNTLTHVQLF